MKKSAPLPERESPIASSRKEGKKKKNFFLFFFLFFFFSLSLFVCHVVLLGRKVSSVCLFAHVDRVKTPSFLFFCREPKKRKANARDIRLAKDWAEYQDCKGLKVKEKKKKRGEKNFLSVLNGEC